MLAIVCPGQGSQTPGFLAPWLELDGTRDLLASLSDAAGVDLIRHGTESDEETIKDTAVAQPLIVAAGLVAAAALEADAAAPESTVVAGHSVGEITAAAVTGGSVTVPDWPTRTTQIGDRWRRILPAFGASVALTASGDASKPSKPSGGHPDEAEQGIHTVRLRRARRPLSRPDSGPRSTRKPRRV